ncbi:uncharacterized protein LOC125941357 [Dermacentor silvarum]|uniref:uncharacterized protein LOC125941357 n=1 Tax=Dermacentor silvarum TaxID=543639 RepID=UPI0021012086|nr:uncharacterized protein LOC125941357 [Dermacentor silvarum]
MQMITAALSHVLLPVLAAACSRPPSEHAPFCHRFSDQRGIAHDFAFPDTCVQPTQQWVLDSSWVPASTSTLSSSSTIKDSLPLRPLCGLGGCATTVAPNPLVFAMQVGTRHSLFAKRCSDYCLVQLPSPHCCLALIGECVGVIRRLLILSGDIETNPGPDTNDVLKELQKISASQNTLISEVQGLKSQIVNTDKILMDLNKRMTELEHHYQAMIPLQNELEAVKCASAQTASLVSVIENRLDDADNRSRRNNLIFYGLPDTNPKETFAQSEKLVIDEIADTMKVNLESKDIERAHRLGRYSPNRHRPIIIKFASYKTKESVLSNGRKLKGTNHSVSEDFSPAVRNARKHLIAYAKSQSMPFSMRFKTLVMGSQRYEYDESTKSVKKIQ